MRRAAFVAIGGVAARGSRVRTGGGVRRRCPADAPGPPSLSIHSLNGYKRTQGLLGCTSSCVPTETAAGPRPASAPSHVLAAPSPRRLRLARNRGLCARYSTVRRSLRHIRLGSRLQLEAAPSDGPPRWSRVPNRLDRALNAPPRLIDTRATANIAVLAHFNNERPRLTL